MTVLGLPRLHLAKDLCPDRHEFAGGLATALILVLEFIWS